MEEEEEEEDSDFEVGALIQTACRKKKWKASKHVNRASSSSCLWGGLKGVSSFLLWCVPQHALRVHQPDPSYLPTLLDRRWSRTAGGGGAEAPPLAARAAPALGLAAPAVRAAARGGAAAARAAGAATAAGALVAPHGAASRVRPLLPLCCARCCVPTRRPSARRGLALWVPASPCSGLWMRAITRWVESGVWGKRWACAAARGDGSTASPFRADAATAVLRALACCWPVVHTSGIAVYPKAGQAGAV